MRSALHFIFAILFGSLLLAQAHATSFEGTKEPIPVGSEPIYLLGKGYADKKDPGHSLAFACVAFRTDGQCRLGRFVEWKNQVANYIGYAIVLQYKFDNERNEVPDMRAIKYDVSSLFVQTQMHNEAAKEARLLMIVGATTATVIGFVVGMPFFGVAYTAMFLVSEGTAGVKLSENGISSAKLERVTHDQNGWNWTTRPKKLRSKTFKMMIKDLESI